MKALMCMFHLEETDGVKVIHCRNGREFRLREIPGFRLDGYCPVTRILYEYFLCHYNGHTCQPFRDVITMNGDTLTEGTS